MLSSNRQSNSKNSSDIAAGGSGEGKGWRKEAFYWEKEKGGVVKRE